MIELRSVLPAFLVRDVRDSVVYYWRVLGIRPDTVIGQHPHPFAIVELAEGQGFHFKRAGDAEVHGNAPGVDAYVRISGVDAFSERLHAQGARVVAAPTDRPWGMREMEVEDLDGHRLCFASDLTGAWPEGRVTTSPDFAVAKVGATAAWYRDVLGFDVEAFGDPPDHAIARRDDAMIHLSGPAKPHSNSEEGRVWDAYVKTTGVAALHDELRGRGATITRGPVVVVYGMREMDVRTPDGHVLCFGEPG